jgi:predicted RNA-binding protein associated with RNAse of E/G family
MAKSAPAVCEVLPPLPATSIDLDALTAALNAGKSGKDAIAEAIVAPAAAPVVAAESAEPEAPAEAPVPDTPEA